MWIAVAMSVLMLGLAALLERPARRLLAAWAEYERTVEGSRYHRHREGLSVAETLAQAARRTRAQSARRYAPAPMWADLTAPLPVVA